MKMLFFSVLFGKVSLFGGQIMSVNNLVSQDLIKVVSNATPLVLGRWHMYCKKRKWSSAQD